MSTHHLKPGDRIRVTARCRLWGCGPGDKGTVLEGPDAGLAVLRRGQGSSPNK
jgi:hypothetical protein